MTEYNHPSFHEIAAQLEAKEKSRPNKYGAYALAIAIIANIIDILSWFVMPQIFGALFLAFRGVHVMILSLVAVILGILGLKSPKTRAISIAAIVLAIISLWPFVTHDWSHLFFRY